MLRRIRRAVREGQYPITDNPFGITMLEPDDKTRLISLANAAANHATHKDNKSKWADFLDYLHVQKVKKESRKRISLEQVKKELVLD
jgi:hypothetical protein